MTHQSIGKSALLASAIVLGLAAISHTAVAGNEMEKRDSTSGQGKSTTNQKNRQTDRKLDSSATRQGSDQNNAAPAEWEKAQGKKGGGSTGENTGMGSSSSQGSSTSGTSSGSGGY